MCSVKTKQVCFLFLFLVGALSGCRSQSEKVPPFTWQQFNGRDECIGFGQKIRRPVYQAKVPVNWRRVNPSSEDSLVDTTLPIISFQLDDNLTVYVHTFPTESLEERIPPEMQVERWKKQIHAALPVVKKVGQSGFCGLYFEGSQGTNTLCGWSLQLDVEHYQTLRFLASTVEEEEHYKQMSADYTIKIVGPTAQIDKHKSELTLFAQSFELIQEIPQNL